MFRKGHQSILAGIALLLIVVAGVYGTLHARASAGKNVEPLASAKVANPSSISLQDSPSAEGIVSQGTI